MTDLDFNKAPQEDPPSDADFDALLKANPNEVLFAPPSYARLDRDAIGSWKVATENGDPVGIVWTDWQDAAGVIPIKRSEGANKLLRYFVTNKMMNAPAGIAFSSSDHIEGLKFEAVDEGELQGAMYEANRLGKGSK